MRKSRVFFLALAVLILLSGLSTAGALDKNAKGELTNWTWTFKCVDEWLVPAFNKVYPNIKIKTVPMSFPETHDKIFAAGGGLSSDGSRWISSKKRFFIHVKVMSAVFRGKFLDHLK